MRSIETIVYARTTSDLRKDRLKKSREEEKKFLIQVLIEEKKIFKMFRMVPT